MMRWPRISLRPETAIALLALFFALGGSALAVGEHVQGTLVAQKRCANGAVRGIAVVTGIPSQGIANLPGNFTGAGAYFGRRFNCTGRAVQARRVEAGVFEVRFAGKRVLRLLQDGYAPVDIRLLLDAAVGFGDAGR